MIDDIVRYLAKAHPDIVPFLKGRARYIGASADPKPYKTYEFFLSAVTRMVTNVYNNVLGGDFIDVLANLISGQITDAYQRAWMDEGGYLPLPPYLQQAADNDILVQYDFVDRFYKDIVDARIDKTPLAPLLARAGMWANQWQASYNNAELLIRAQTGGNLIWQVGLTEHCGDCSNLNGVVASAEDWVNSGWQPQSRELECHGYNCQCTLTPINQKRSYNYRTKLGIA